MASISPTGGVVHSHDIMRLSRTYSSWLWPFLASHPQLMHSVSRSAAAAARSNARGHSHWVNGPISGRITGSAGGR